MRHIGENVEPRTRRLADVRSGESVDFYGEGRYVTVVTNTWGNPDLGEDADSVWCVDLDDGLLRLEPGDRHVFVSDAYVVIPETEG